MTHNAEIDAPRCTATSLGGACWPPSLCVVHGCDDTDEGCHCEDPEPRVTPPEVGQP
jgi:hypothetical protein